MTSNLLPMPFGPAYAGILQHIDAEPFIEQQEKVLESMRQGYAKHVPMLLREATIDGVLFELRSSITFGMTLSTYNMNCSRTLLMRYPGLPDSYIIEVMRGNIPIPGLNDNPANDVSIGGGIGYHHQAFDNLPAMHVQAIEGYPLGQAVGLPPQLTEIGKHCIMGVKISAVDVDDNGWLERGRQTHRKIAILLKEESWLFESSRRT